jgi:tetratricopeptide (TPR) repeat protein
MTVAMLVLLLLPGLALTVRNVIVGHDLVFIASQGGVNFYIGNNPYSDGSTAIVPGTPASWIGGYRETIRQAVADAGRPLSPSEVSRYYYRKGLQFWTEHPATAWKLLGLKLRHLVLGVELSNNQNIHFWRDQSPLLRLPIFVGWAWLVSLGAVGIFRVRRSWHAAALWGFLAAYGAGLVVFFVNERFRMPLTVVLCLFAGIALAELAAALRNRRWRPAVGMMVAVAAIYACTGFGRIGFRGDRVEEDAFSRYTVGDVYLDESQPEEALRWYRDAYAVARRYHPPGARQMIAAHPIRMARAYAMLRDADRLAQELDAIPSSATVDLDVLTLRADLLRLRHQDAQACDLYRQVIERVPELWQAQVGAGWCALQHGRRDDARRCFQQVLEVKPGEPQALAGLGALAAREDPVRARELLERALSQNPRLPRAHRLLARLDATEGRVEAARGHLQEALRLDPDDAELRRQLDRLR